MGYAELSFQASWLLFCFHSVVNLVEVALKISVIIIKVESVNSNSYKMALSCSAFGTHARLNLARAYHVTGF